MSAAKVPAWVTDGWYANNPEKQQLAIARYYSPVATEAERVAAREFSVPKNRRESHACSSCGRFAFAAPRICFWCERATLEFKP
jgi:hypothetical protein